MKRPQRPKSYQLPSFIELRPVKPKMRKPYWMVKTDRIGVTTCRTKAEAYEAINARMLRAYMTDQELYQALYKSCGCVLVNQWAYFRKGKFYIAKDDKHEWHHADEVDMLLYLAAQNQQEAA